MPGGFHPGEQSLAEHAVHLTTRAGQPSRSAVSARGALQRVQRSNHGAPHTARLLGFKRREERAERGLEQVVRVKLGPDFVHGVEKRGRKAGHNGNGLLGGANRCPLQRDERQQGIREAFARRAQRDLRERPRRSQRCGCCGRQRLHAGHEACAPCARAILGVEGAACLYVRDALRLATHLELLAAQRAA